MTVIAIPVFRVSCNVGIDKGRAWSTVDELILWAIARQSKTIGTLASESNLPHQLIVASIARLMRFRLVEVIPLEDSAAFRASEYGSQAIRSGNPLPFFPKRHSRRVSFVVERATGDFFLSRETRLTPRYKLDQERREGVDVRYVVVNGNPPVSNEANFNRLSELIARNWDEQIAFVDGSTASQRDDEFMVVRVLDGIPLGLPKTASEALREIVAQGAALPKVGGQLTITYAGAPEAENFEPVFHSCTFNPSDLIIGGTAQRMCLLELLNTAHRRVVILSTFLRSQHFSELLGPIRAACARGITFDVLWGAELDEKTEHRNSTEATEIMRIVRQDPNTNGRFRIHMKSTGSHAKIILVDTVDGGWIAAVGSCNWLSSPMQAVELTVVLRDPAPVAEIAAAVQRTIGRRGLSDAIANEMGLVARDLRRLVSVGGTARVAIIVGDVHDRLMRGASGAAKRRFVTSSHRLGSTARPGALMPGEVAAGRPGVTATVLYNRVSGPIKDRHARVLVEEVARSGLRVIQTNKIPLHGKFIAWDDDDLVVTSLNWASASTDLDFPWGDVGVHIHMPGIAQNALLQLGVIYPELNK